MRYQEKAPAFELFLDRLNDSVAAEFEYDEPLRVDLAVGHIVGLPRSGTTLLFQLLAASGFVGYPSNLMAMFWRAPHVGATLQRQLADTSKVRSFESLAGRTPEPLDPHEFGYFWRSALGHASNTFGPSGAGRQPSDIQRDLDLVNSAFNAPTIYKNFYVPAHTTLFSRDLNRQVFILLDRPLMEVAASLLHVRRSLGIATEQSFGITPADLHESYPSEEARVWHQAVSLDRSVADAGLTDLQSCVRVGYEALCGDPRDAVHRVLAALDQHTGLQGLASLPTSLSPRSPIQSLSRGSRTALERAMSELPPDHR